MGWSIGYDENWKRDVGYGVRAHCDHPGCSAEIDRGLAYVCGGEPYGGEHGCGLYFCGHHLYLSPGDSAFVCDRCSDGKEPFDAKPDHPEWVRHKLTDDSWQRWRDEHPEEAAELARTLPARVQSGDAGKAERLRGKETI